MKTKPTEERAEFISFTWGQTDKSRHEKTLLKSTTGMSTRMSTGTSIGKHHTQWWHTLLVLE